jgi:hypothetical protein
MSWEGIEMYQFTAARAEQHRADMMAAATRASAERAARGARGRRLRPSIWHRLPAIKLARVAHIRKVSPARAN